MPVTDQPVSPLTDNAQLRTDDILTLEQRRANYRQKLIERQKGRKIRLKAFLQRKRQYFRSLDETARRKRAEDIDLMCRYFNGDQYGSYDEAGNYRDQKQDGDFAYSIPILNGHVEQAFIQVFKTRPQYKFAPDDSDDTNMVQVSKMCEEIADKEMSRLMDGAAAQREIYNTLLGRESYRELYWAPNPKAPKRVTRMDYRREEIALPASKACQACKAVVPVTDNSPPPSECPECGSTYLKDNPGGMTYRHVPSGEKQVTLGENRLHIPHPLSMQRDMSALTPEDSTFLIERSYLDRHVAEFVYQGEIEAGNLGLSPEMQLRHDLERSSIQTDAIAGSARAGGISGPGRQPFGGEGASVHGQKVEQERHRWKVAEYGWFYCDVEETLPDGSKIPAGTLLGDHFPEGLKVTYAGDSVIDIRPLNQSPVLVQYGFMAGTNSGAGLHKLIPLQDVINDDFNLGQAVKNTVGHPLTAIQGNAIYELPGAGQLLKISKAGVDDIRSLIAQYPGQSMPDDGTQERVNAVMQFIAKTNTVGTSPGGAPDMRAAAGTATGIAAMTEQVASGQVGPVDQRITADKETRFQVLENIQEYCAREKSPEQYQEMVKRWGSDTVEAFFKCNLRQSLTATVAANSDVPKSMALSQANQIAFGQIAQGILPVVAKAPQLQSQVMEWLSSLADAMGIPLRIGEGRTDRREAEYRLNKLSAIEERILARQPMLAGNPHAVAALLYKGIAEIASPLIEQQPGGPEADAPRVFLQNHDAFLDVYKDAVFSERAKSWSEGKRLVVLQLWMDHFKAKVGMKVETAQLEAEVNSHLQPQQPSPEQLAQLQQQQEAQKHEQQVTQDEMEHQRAEEASAAEHARSEQSAAAEHQRSQEAADADALRTAALQAHKGDVQIAVDENKAKAAKRYSAFQDEK